MESFQYQLIGKNPESINGVLRSYIYLNEIKEINNMKEGRKEIKEKGNEGWKAIRIKEEKKGKEE